MADPEESDYSGSSDSEEDNSSSDDEEQHERPVKDPRNDAAYNTEGLHEKLEEIGAPEDLEWTHFLAITYPDTGIAVDVDDDLQREMSFYSQALEGAREAYQKLQSLGIPFQRPIDYYAEMVKTDSHMLKIKDKLLQEKSNLEDMEERKKARESKKFSKEVQAEKLKERAKRKKDDIESVKKWRKVRQKSGFTEGGEDAPPVEFNTGRKNKQDEKFSGRDGGRDRQSSKNRQFRNSKYGNGDRKSDKRNTAESSADDSTFRASFKGRGRGRGTSGARGGRGGRGGSPGGSFRGRSGSRGRGGRGRGRF